MEQHAECFSAFAARPQLGGVPALVPDFPLKPPVATSEVSGFGLRRVAIGAPMELMVESGRPGLRPPQPALLLGFTHSFGLTQPPTPTRRGSTSVVRLAFVAISICFNAACMWCGSGSQLTARCRSFAPAPREVLR